MSEFSFEIDAVSIQTRIGMSGRLLMQQCASIARSAASITENPVRRRRPDTKISDHRVLSSFDFARHES
jgi:hypothetical protein